MVRGQRQFGNQGRRAYISEPNRKELTDMLARRYRRDLINRGIIPDPTTRAARYKFTWAYGKLNGIVYADNRSLARSLIKQELGIRKKNRLPIEVEITRELNKEDNDEDSTGSPEKNTNFDNKRTQACGAI